MSVSANSYWTMLTYNVCSNADEDYGYWTKWKRDIGYDEEEEWSELRYVGCQCISNGLLEVVKEKTTL